VILIGSVTGHRATLGLHLSGATRSGGLADGAKSRT
jgi:hypothetical protein